MLMRLALPCALILAAACGGSDSDGADGGDASNDAPAEKPGPDRYSPEWPGSCDPTDQNCAMGSDCTLDCNALEFSCTAATGATSGHGEACTVGSCARGHVCLGGASGATCKKFCKTDADCPMGKSCTVMGVNCKEGARTLGWLCFP